jgi:penicillin-binding protein 1C
LKNLLLHINRSVSTASKIKCLVTLILLIWFWWALPSRLFNAPTCYVIEDKNGQLLNASIAADGQWRFPYNKEVPQNLLIASFVLKTKDFLNIPE